MTSLTEYFSRRSTAPAPVAPVAAPEGDAVYLQAWGLTPEQWAAMDHAGRVWHRWNFNRAPHFGA